MIIGVVAAIVPYIFVMYVKNAFGYDDALDTFGVHAVGGTLGAILTGLLADSRVNANLQAASPANPATVNGLAKAITGHTLVFQQLEAVGVTLVISIVGTVVIAYAVKLAIGLRTTPEVETVGLDLNEHNEEGYIL
jgi:Amt family ammonium transporter